jgi:hypothetical protein
VHKYRLNMLSLSVDLPIVKPEYKNFGIKSELKGPIMFHGRTSTNSKGLKNTHPIVKNDWHLVHNGVVSNKGPDYPMTTDNDTEHLVHYLSTVGITGIESNLTGYYAFGAIAPDGKLHIARDSNARLVTCRIPTIDSYAFATTTDLIEKTCKHMGWKHGPIDIVEDNLYMIFDGNILIKNQTIKPRGYGYSEEKHMGASLHYLQEPSSSYRSKGSGSNKFYDEYDYSSGYIKESDYSNSSVSDLDLSNVDLDVVDYLDQLDVLPVDAKVYDASGREIDKESFLELSDSERLEYLVTRGDGTPITPMKLLKQAGEES